MKPLARSLLFALSTCALDSSCSLLPARSDSAAAVRRGPIAQRVHQPLALTFLAFRPRSLRTQPPGSLGIGAWSNYSSMFENGFSSDEEVVLDGELWRNSVSLRAGVSPDTDVEVEIPLLYASSGFLDTFLESYHHALGLPSGGSDERPAGEYEMEISTGGERAWHLEGNRLGLGDVPVVLTQRIHDEDATTPALAWRAGIEFPTGSESNGFGNGAIDYGGGLLAERTFGRWTATGALDYVSRARSGAFADAGIDVEDLFDVQLGVEYRWNDELSLLSGLIYNTPLVRDIDLKEIDRDVLELDLGLAWDSVAGSRITFGFSEDLVAESGPDFGMFAGWSLWL